jgi:hypothetical protein
MAFPPIRIPDFDEWSLYDPRSFSDDPISPCSFPKGDNPADSVPDVVTHCVTPMSSADAPIRSESPDDSVSRISSESPQVDLE